MMMKLTLFCLVVVFAAATAKAVTEDKERLDDTREIETVGDGKENIYRVSQKTLLCPIKMFHKNELICIHYIVLIYMNLNQIILILANLLPLLAIPFVTFFPAHGFLSAYMEVAERQKLDPCKLCCRGKVNLDRSL